MAGAVRSLPTGAAYPGIDTESAVKVPLRGRGGSVTERERSTGELAEAIGKLERAIDQLRETQSRQIDTLSRDLRAQIASALPRELYEAKHAALVAQVATLAAELREQDSRLTYAFRTAVTAFLMPILVGLVFFMLRSGGGGL